jgi:tripartite-type tricarboxylate transporter receptor subunit TctC
MTGGSGVVAMTYVKESTPDGYTVGYLPCELAMVKAQGLTEIIEPSAFDMIYACNIQPAAITVSADSEWDSIEDLVAWCKEHPGELQVGTSGTGSVWHIAADAFAKAAGIEINLVPFDGAATAVTNLMGGHVQMVPVSESEVASGVASGKLKILAVCSSDRSEFNPDVPTLQELGYDVDVTAWGGFGVAKGTPDDVKEVLYAAFEKAVNSEEFKELASQGQYSPLIMDHEEFAEFAQSQYEFYTEYFTDTAQ